MRLRIFIATPQQAVGESPMNKVLGCLLIFFGFVEIGDNNVLWGLVLLGFGALLLAEASQAKS